MAKDKDPKAPRISRKPSRAVVPLDDESFAHKNLTEDFYLRILGALEAAPKKLDGLLAQLHPADVADLIERLPRHRRDELIEHVSDERLGEVIAELEPGVQEHVLNLLKPDEVREVLEELDSDDAADIAQAVEESAPESAETEAEALLTDYKHKRLLNYEPDSAGGLMQLEVVTALGGKSVGETLSYLRENEEELPGKPGTVFVVNEWRKLIGTVSLSRLVRVPLTASLSDVMRRDPLSVQPDVPQAEVVRMFEKYDIHNLAVVNKRGQLLGRITIDDVLDVVLAEGARVQARAVGLDEDEDLFAPATHTTRQRLPWLAINLITAVMASGVIAMFESSIAKLTTLAVLMPIVASMGGNATTQTQTVVIRGLALGQITRQNAWELLKKEFLAGGYLGSILCFAMALGVWLLYGNYKLALVIALATVANHLIAAIGGFATPLLLKKFNFDPAIATGVITTTFTDVGGFFVFLGLATWFLL